MTMPMMTPKTSPTRIYLAKSAILPSLTLYLFMVLPPNILKTLTGLAVKSAFASMLLAQTADRTC